MLHKKHRVLWKNHRVHHKKHGVLRKNHLECPKKHRVHQKNIERSEKNIWGSYFKMAVIHLRLRFDKNDQNHESLVVFELFKCNLSHRGTVSLR